MHIYLSVLQQIENVIKRSQSQISTNFDGKMKLHTEYFHITQKNVVNKMNILHKFYKCSCNAIQLHGGFKVLRTVVLLARVRFLSVIVYFFHCAHGWRVQFFTAVHITIILMFIQMYIANFSHCNIIYV